MTGTGSRKGAVWEGFMKNAAGQPKKGRLGQFAQKSSRKADGVNEWRKRDGFIDI